MKVLTEADKFRIQVQKQLEALREKEQALAEEHEEALAAHLRECHLCSESRECAECLQLKVKYKRRRNNVLMQQVDLLRWLTFLRQHAHCAKCTKSEKRLSECSAMGCTDRQDAAIDLIEEIWRLMALTHEDEEHNLWNEAYANFYGGQRATPFGARDLSFMPGRQW